MIAFIDDHKGRRTEGLVWGVEPICAVLPIASQTYYAARSRLASARRLRDEMLEAEVLRVWEQNYSVYGAPKIDSMEADGGNVSGRAGHNGATISTNESTDLVKS